MEKKRERERISSPELGKTLELGKMLGGRGWPEIDLECRKRAIIMIQVTYLRNDVFHTTTTTTIPFNVFHITHLQHCDVVGHLHFWATSEGAQNWCFR